MLYISLIGVLCLNMIAIVINFYIEQINNKWQTLVVLKAKVNILRPMLQMSILNFASFSQLFWRKQ